MVLSDLLSHEQRPAGKTGASLLVKSLPVRDRQALLTNRSMHTPDKSKL